MEGEKRRRWGRRRQRGPYLSSKRRRPPLRLRKSPFSTNNTSEVSDATGGAVLDGSELGSPSGIERFRALAATSAEGQPPLGRA